MSDEKVREVDFVKNPDKEAMEKLRRALPQLIELEIIRAKVAKAKYDALINEGFTAEQALEMCKQPPS